MDPHCRRLVGKVAVVTASTDGIGLAIARRLAQEGAKVVVSSRKQKNVDKTVEQLKSEKLDVTGVVCHAGKEDDRKNLLLTASNIYGGIDILVANAALNTYNGPVLNTPMAAWDKIFETNVKATFYLCKEAVPYMQQRGGGSIVLVSSMSAYQPNSSLSAYGISKTTLLGMVRALVPQLTELNVRINAIAPGVIKTSFSRGVWESPATMQRLKTLIPMPGLGTPEQCAGPTAFLVSDDASYITGETLVIAGGRFSHL